MVDFNKLGKNVGPGDEKPIDVHWSELAPKQKAVIVALINHPHLSQKEIADMTDSHPAHVHDVIHRLLPEQYETYKGQYFQEQIKDMDIQLEEQMDEANPDVVSLTARVPVNITVQFHRNELVPAIHGALTEGVNVNPTT